METPIFANKILLESNTFILIEHTLKTLWFRFCNFPRWRTNTPHHTWVGTTFGHVHWEVYISRSDADNSHSKMTTPEVNTDYLPTVVRIRRCRGEVVQGCDIYIGRMVERGGWRLPQSDWANPFTVRTAGSRQNALIRYEHYIRHERPDLWRRLPELEGKTLGCWCEPEPCHGDVLVQLVKEHKREINSKDYERRI